MAILRWLWRLFGACGHEWEWGPDLLQFGSTFYQRAMCMRCGKIKQRAIGWAAEVDKYGVKELRSQLNRMR